MSKITEDSKQKEDGKKESISNENTELNEEALEQVNGGSLKLKTKQDDSELPPPTGYDMVAGVKV